MREDLLKRLKPEWRRVRLEKLDGIEVEVRAPTVAAAARIPMAGWWASCVRFPDGSPFLPEGFDPKELDANVNKEIVEAVMGPPRPSSPPSDASPGG